MKVLVLTILLVSICCLEGAFVKRQAEGDSQAPAQETSQYLQSLTQLFSHDLFSEENIGQLRTQAQTFAQQAQKSLEPWAQQMRESFTQIFTAMGETVKKATTTSS